MTERETEMAVAIRVPDLGTTVDEVTLVAWLVEEGEQVRRGDALAEIQTDKATSELESVAEGVLLKQVVAADTEVTKGDILAYVGQPGEALPEPEASVDTATPETPARPVPQADTPRVSVMVRNLAGQLGLDLSRVRGTGQGGMITRQDVQRAAKAVTTGGEPLSRAQAAVAKAVLKSVQTIPHLRLTAQIDMTSVMALRAKAKESGEKLSYDAILLKALAKAVGAVPLVAARLEGERIVHPDGLHMAIAVGRGNDLLLPVVRDVDKKDLAAVHRDIADFANRGQIKLEEMTGGCMTLSNLGMYPIESFDAIIFPEHSTILAVGTTQKKPVVVEDRVEIRPLVQVTLSVDHRLINGRMAAEFLTKVKEILESGEIT